MLLFSSFKVLAGKPHFVWWGFILAMGGLWLLQKKGHIIILSNVQLLSSVSCRSSFGFDFYFGLSCLILVTHLPSSCFLFSCPHYLVCEYLSCLLVFICFAINVAYSNCLLQCSLGPFALFRAVVTAEWWSEVLWIYISEAPEEVQEVSRIAGL